MILPGWVGDVGDTITKCFSSDESDPPELELDPVLHAHAASLLGDVDNGRAKDCSTSATPVTDVQGGKARRPSWGGASGGRRAGWRE